MFKGNIEKILGILLIIVLAFNFFFVVYIVNTTNEKYKRIDERIVELSGQVEEIQQIEDPVLARDAVEDKTVDFLKQEFLNYRDFANSDRESFISLVNIFFVALGVLVTGGTIVLYWIFGQTKTEVKENADLTIRTSINEIEQEAKEKIKSLIDPKIEEFEEKYKELERFMDNQYSLRKSRVSILCPQNKKEDMEKLELMRIRSIVGEAQIMDLNNFKGFERKVKNGEVEIIVYIYEIKSGENQEEIIRKYIQLLKDLHLEIPIVIYATFPNRVEGEDLEMINSYPFSVIANLPTSLTSNMISLANVLSYEKG